MLSKVEIDKKNQTKICTWSSHIKWKPKKSITASREASEDQCHPSLGLPSIFCSEACTSQQGGRTVTMNPISIWGPRIPLAIGRFLIFASLLRVLFHTRRNYRKKHSLSVFPLLFRSYYYSTSTPKSYIRHFIIVAFSKDPITMVAIAITKIMMAFGLHL